MKIVPSSPETAFFLEHNVPWTKRGRLHESDLDLDVVLVTLDGVLLGVVREAQAGEKGWVEHALQVDGEFVFATNGDPQFVREEGHVQFWIPKQFAETA